MKVKEKRWKLFASRL